MDILNKLMDLYKEINDIYINLCKEDINELSSDKGYKYLVKILKEKVSEEEKLFKELFKSDDYDEIKTIIFEEDNQLMLRMRDYIKIYESLNIKIEDTDDEEIIEDKVLTMKIAKLMCSCIKNIFLIYSSFLDEYVSLTTASQIRERLLTIKYYNAFTKHDIEQILLNCEFNVPTENYVDVYLVAETLGIKIDECDEIILDSYLSAIFDMINQIMSLEDYEYKDYNKLAVIINASFMLQACFALLSDKDYSMNKEKIFEKIEELENDNNKKSTNIIYEIINMRKQCQKRVRKISMRPNIG